MILRSVWQRPWLIAIENLGLHYFADKTFDEMSVRNLVVWRWSVVIGCCYVSNEGLSALGQEQNVAWLCFAKEA